jgi:hypothetical protein
MSDFLIRCTDCPRSEQITWLPMEWHATCHECATTSVKNHLLEHPLHRCEILSSTPEPAPLRRKAGHW